MFRRALAGILPDFELPPRPPSRPPSGQVEVKPFKRGLQRGFSVKVGLATAYFDTEAEAQAFARLHRVSVILNGVTLLAGLALICLEAVRSRG